MTTTAESLIFQVLRQTRVVERESFTLATFDPGTGSINGRLSAAEFAAELIETLGLCRHALTACTECEPANE
jgi:hypothetical protein